MERIPGAKVSVTFSGEATGPARLIVVDHLQRSEGFGEYRQRRVVVEHRLARLVQLGIRQSRYFERAKTKFRLYLEATVANLTLVAAKADLPAGTGGDSSADSALRAGSIRSVPAWRGSLKF